MDFEKIMEHAGLTANKNSVPGDQEFLKTSGIRLGTPAATTRGFGTEEFRKVGHWVAEHPSNGGIGSWWDFRPDGTLTMHIGAIVTSPITRSGDTFTSPPVSVNGPPIKVTFRISKAIRGMRA